MIDSGFWWKVLLIAVLLGLAASQLYPPDQRLKGGIDLQGGHSLLYEIDDTGIAPERKRDLAERVMQILKERVDPQGQRNLIWRPMGTNRLEIQIPKPPEKVVRAREGYKEVRNKVAETELSRNEIRQALNRKGPARQDALQGLVHGVESRKPLLAPLAEAYDAWQNKQAKMPDTDASEEAYEAYLEKEDELLKTNINVERVEDILALGQGEERQEELAKIYDEHPSLKPLIEDLVAAYDPWADQRGALDDPADLKRLLMGAGVLEFRILPVRDPQRPTLYDEYIRNLEKRGPRAREEDQYAWFEIKNPPSFLRMEEAEDFDEAFDKVKATLHFIVERYANKYYVLASRQPGDVMVASRGEKGRPRWSLEAARASRDPQTNQPCVLFTLDERGGALMEQVSRAHKGDPLAILLDDVVYSAPTLQSTIRSRGQITGDFTVDDVMYLVNTLEAGSLPARLKPTPIMEKSIGPSLGLTNRTRGMKAAVIGLICVAIFMLIYYLHAGFLADVAVLMNLILVLGIMAMLQATFTLPGIAGLILTVGMAVDANVLIFERIREEQKRGSTLRAAVKAGYEKALSTILDANITTLITCAILGYVGSEEVKGFAYTLGFGIVTSLFTALFVTRQFFNLMLADRVSAESLYRPALGLGVLLAVGGALYGLALVLSAPDSVAAGLGEFFAICGVAGAIVYALMWGARFALRGPGGSAPKTLPMLQLIRKPSIDWMGKRAVFWPISAVLVFSCLFFFIYQDRYHSDDLYSIEFLGGTAAQIEVKPESALLESEAGVDEAIRQAVVGADPDNAAGWLLTVAKSLDAAEVKAAETPGTFDVTAPDLNARQIQSFILAVYEDRLERQEGVAAPSGQTYTVVTRPDDEGGFIDTEGMKQVLEQAARYARQAYDRLRHAGVQIVELETATGEEPPATFEITTTETDARVVREAIVASIGSELVIQPAVSLQVHTSPKAEQGEPAAQGLYPVEKQTLGAVLNNDPIVGAAAGRDVSAYSGGVAFVVKDLEPAIDADAIQQRLQQMRLQPDFEAYAWRPFEVIPLKQTPDGKCQTAAVVVSDEHFLYDESAKDWQQNLAEPELKLTKAALETGKSLQKVTRFSPSVAQQSKARALAAIVLALAVIVGYIWLRFGSMTFGLCAIAALVHDVSICVGLVALCHFIHDTPIGWLFGITDFRIDLSMIAAFLTIIGYSLNDTIVVFDRIRENRGKLATVDDRMVTESINQTLSRTLLTSLTTLFVVTIMYIFGGPGIHGFNYALIVGVMVGTYSSIGIAGALLVSPSALRVFYFVLSGSILSVTMLGLALEWEGLAVVAGATILVVSLIHGELRGWRSQRSVPQEVWTASFGWVAAVIVTWALTAMVITLTAPDAGAEPSSVGQAMLYVRGIVAVGVGVYGAALVLRAVSRVSPMATRATA